MSEVEPKDRGAECLRETCVPFPLQTGSAHNPVAPESSPGGRPKAGASRSHDKRESSSEGGPPVLSGVP